MPFVKLDCGILNSTLWFDRTAREVFITALLMAEPWETTDAVPQLEVDALTPTGWSVPPGWYGFVPAAGVGILHRARVDMDVGKEALRILGSPEDSSRSQEFDGRRLVRVDGGYVVLSFMKYRDRDYTGAERAKRYRARVASRRDNAASRRDITQAEAEVEVEVDQIGKNVSFALSADSTKPDADEALHGSVPVLTFHTVGTKAKSWALMSHQVSAWIEAYPDTPVLAECRKALAWIEADSSRRKTAKGMPKFLVGWLNRATDRGGGGGRAAHDPRVSTPKTAGNLAAIGSFVARMDARAKAERGEA